ncbi:MAG: DUF72 domain-containing protein [Candidatus Heimdallarchaeota archaeon]|nr:DUF72 domain-containing protein [Candidatus Heimdallarchaeota archaeon]
MDNKQIYVGCTGFNYNDWKANLGGFYPPDVKNHGLLGYYATQFSTCEVNSSFYAFPKIETTKRWNKLLPDDFVLTAKIPKIIAQAENIALSKENLYTFLNIMSPLKKKLGPLVMQFAPSFDKNSRTVEELDTFVNFFPQKDYTLLLEFRHKTWFNKETYDFLNEKKLGIVSSYLPYLKLNLCEEVKSEYFYLRIIGSHNTETGLGKQVLDQSKVVEEIVDKLSTGLAKNPNKKSAYVYINQHFSGYAPPIAKKFREMLEERNLSTVLPEKTAFKGQHRLSDFFG